MDDATISWTVILSFKGKGDARNETVRAPQFVFLQQHDGGDKGFT